MLILGLNNSKRTRGFINLVWSNMFSNLISNKLFKKNIEDYFDLNLMDMDLSLCTHDNKCEDEENKRSGQSVFSRHSQCSVSSWWFPLSDPWRNVGSL